MSYEIKKLLPRHYKIMDLLLLLGKKQKEIAEELSLTEQTVSSVVNSRVFKEHLPGRMAEFLEKPGEDGVSAGELLHSRLADAAKRLCEMLDSDDDRVALRAAQDILDRGGHAKITRTNSVRQSIVLIDDKTAKRIEQTILEMSEPLQEISEFNSELFL